MSAETDTVDAETDDSNDEAESFEYIPQVKQHPHTIIAGHIVGIMTGADLDSQVESTGSSFGVIFENPTVPEGSIWANRDVPDGFATVGEYHDTLKMAAADDDAYIRGQEVTDERQTDARERLHEEGVIPTVDADIDISFTPQEGLSAMVDGDDVAVDGSTDFKVADRSDKNASVQEIDDKTLGIDVGGGVYPSQPKDGFDVDRIMVWYGGLAGQFIGRALDMNGLPSARYKDDGYLVKGLLQHPIGWFERDTEQFDNVPTSDRVKLATDLNRAPRVARPPVLRDDLTDDGQFIELYRSDSGGAHYATVAHNDFDDEPADATEIEPLYNPDADEVLADEFENVDRAYSLYHGEGWQNEVTGDGGSTDTDSSGGSFDVSVDVDGGEEVSHPTDNETQFGEMVAEKIAGTGVTPDEDIFPIGEDQKTNLEGLVGHNAEQFEVDPDIDAIRNVVYENTSHLDPDDL